jgi:uncharacterized membrane protein
VIFALIYFKEIDIVYLYFCKGGIKMINAINTNPTQTVNAGANVLFDGTNVWDELIVMGVFALSCVIGVLLISKLMGILLKRWKGAVYFFIFGLILGSPFSIIWAACHNDDYDINFKSPGMWCASVICLIIGCLLPLMVRFIEKKMNEKKILADSTSQEEITSDTAEELEEQ